ncbi:MAG: ABC transporter ATP-binding protein [Acidobacteriota bacterium]|nr:ABC transporter ATP-binding protein [Acidobacteriota bacterium]
MAKSTLVSVTATAEAVQLQGLTKSWRGPDGPIHAVRGIDLSIRQGETVALLGPNGAGKTTTIDMVLGLIPPDAGTASVLGGTPRDAVQHGLVGAMLQTGDLIRNLTVRELITMLTSLYPKPMPVGQVIELAGLGDAAGQLTQKLSGGQTQRVRFAVAIASDPQLMILDEPTSAMDVEARRVFWTSMRAFAASGRTLIFATHYLDEADTNADRVVLLANGEIVADGSTTEIKGRVGRRHVSATLTDVGADELLAITGVTAVDRHGDSVTLTCSDSDGALRELLARYPQASDIEVIGARLEDAFLELTAEGSSAA